MDPFALIAEQRIAQAMQERDLNSPKWKNRPLPLDDDGFVPAELKMAYKILKNSGHLPPEVEDRKEVERLEDLIGRTTDERERLKQMKKLSVLLMKIDAKRSFASSISSQNDYYQNVVERISVNAKDRSSR